MGQQQLLLIVLSVIVVSIAVVAGINMYKAYLITANEESVVAETLNIGGLAQLYYLKPNFLSGGQGSFEGFSIPFSLADKDNGTYAVTSVSQNEIVVTGTGKVLDSQNKVARSVVTIQPNNISTSNMTRVNP
jgi:hypothetical protein